MASPIETWMPLYIGDALRETIGMTLEERGAYIWLNMSLWQSGGSLPMDPPRLARSIGCDVATFNRVWESISPIYDVVDGCIRSRRLDEHMSRALKAHQSLAERGKAGAAKRWDGRAMAEPCVGDSRGMAGDAPSPSPSFPSTSSPPSTETAPRAKRSAPLPDEIDFTRADRMRASAVAADKLHRWEPDSVWKSERVKVARSFQAFRTIEERPAEMLDTIAERWGTIPATKRAWSEKHPLKGFRQDMPDLYRQLTAPPTSQYRQPQSPQPASAPMRIPPGKMIVNGKLVDSSDPFGWGPHPSTLKKAQP